MNLDRQETLKRAWVAERQRILRELIDYGMMSSEVRVYPLMPIGGPGIMAPSQEVKIERFILTVEWVSNDRGRYRRIVCEDILVEVI